MSTVSSVPIRIDRPAPGVRLPVVAPAAPRPRDIVYERVAAGRAIVWEGDATRSAFQLVEGTVRHCRMLLDGRRIIAGFGHAGDLFGLAAMGRYLFTTEAVTDCRIRRIASSQSGWAEDGEDGVFADRLCAQQLRMQDGLLRMLHMSADERVATFMLNTARRLCANLSTGSRFLLAMPRSDMADHLGLSVETVCRVVTRLRREGAIRLEANGFVVVSDLAMLRLHAGDETYGELEH